MFKLTVVILWLLGFVITVWLQAVRNRRRRLYEILHPNKVTSVSSRDLDSNLDDFTILLILWPFCLPLIAFYLCKELKNN